MREEVQGLRPKTRRITVTDLARAAGVSRSTVSLVLRNSPLVKRETGRRVEDAIDRLGYVYNRNAANLRRRTSDMVAMVINDLTNPFFAELAVGLEDALQAAGYVSLMANTDEDPARQRRVMETMREHGAAGFILCPAMGTDTGQAAAMADWNVPVSRSCAGCLALGWVQSCPTMCWVHAWLPSGCWRSAIGASPFSAAATATSSRLSASPATG